MSIHLNQEHVTLHKGNMDQLVLTKEGVKNKKLEKVYKLTNYNPKSPLIALYLVNLMF